MEQIEGRIHAIVHEEQFSYHFKIISDDISRIHACYVPNTNYWHELLTHYTRSRESVIFEGYYINGLLSVNAILPIPLEFRLHGAL